MLKRSQTSPQCFCYVYNRRHKLLYSLFHFYCITRTLRHTGKSLPQTNNLHDVTVQFQSYHPHLLSQCSSFLTPLIFCTADRPVTALNCVTQRRPHYLHYSVYYFILKFFFSLSAHSTNTSVGTADSFHGG